VTDRLQRQLETETDVIEMASDLVRYLSVSERDERDWKGREEPDVTGRDILDALQAAMPSVPGVVRDFVTEVPPLSDEWRRRAYIIVDCIDHLVGTNAHPRLPPRNDPWKALYKRLLRTGRYNTGTESAVIPAPVGPVKIRYADLGRHLCFTRSILPCSLRYRWIRGLGTPSRAGFTFALVPAPHRHDAAAHTQSAGFDLPHYEVSHSYTAAEQEALLATLREIDAQRTHRIAIFPEAALDSSRMHRLREEFHTIGNTHGRADSQRLQLLMLGHCGGSTGHGFNCVTVLMSDGLEAWTQAKVNGYRLDNKTIQRDCLDLRLLPDKDSKYAERLNLPPLPTVVVADTPFGRIMIAICEDISHLEPSIKAATEALVTHLVVPLLNRALTSSTQEWYLQRVRSLSLESNCNSIICTSAFLEQRCRRRGAATGDEDDPVGVLVINAPPWDSVRNPVKWKPKEKSLWVSAPWP
jgi:predicted amidohydrolase